MKNLWEQIPTVVKATTVITAAVAGAIMWLLSTFETTTASELKWVQHNQAIACNKVYDLKKEMREYLEKRKDATTDADREFYETQIAVIQEEISRLDPNGQC